MLPALNESARFRYFTFFCLYAMLGIPAGFALTAIGNYLIGQGVNSASVGTFIAIVGIPWILQFVWGPVIDRYQYSVIGRRKQWVLIPQIFALLSTLALLMVKDPTKDITLMSVIFFTNSLFASIQDTSVDAISISVVPERERGRVNAYMRGGFLLGYSFGAALLSTLLHDYSFYLAALVQSIALGVLTVMFFFTKIDRRDALLPTWGKKQVLPDGHTPEQDNPSMKRLFTQLWKGMTTKESLRIFGLMAVAYLCFSIFIESFTFYIIRTLHWPDRDVSVIQGSWANLLTFGVVLIGGTISDRIGASRLQVIVMWSLGIFLVLLCGSYHLWVNRAFTTGGLVLWSFADPLMSVAAFPILMALCKPQVEGSQFTAYMAFINLCSVTGSYLAGQALRVIDAPWLGLACGAVVTAVAATMSYRRLKEKRNSLATVSLDNAH